MAQRKRKRNPKMIGNFIEGVEEIRDNVREKPGELMKLSYMQAIRLPPGLIKASLDTTDKGSRGTYAKRWFRWFAHPEDVLHHADATTNMKAKARESLAGRGTTKVWGQRASNPTVAQRKRKRNNGIDQSAATELRLWIDNDGDLYRRQTTPIMKNLMAKMASGKYSHAQAPKLWDYLVESGAKSYAKDNLDRSTPWHRIFPPALRKQVAKELADDYRDAVNNGEYDNMVTQWVPKKYQPWHGKGGGGRKNPGVTKRFLNKTFDTDTVKGITAAERFKAKLENDGYDVETKPLGMTRVTIVGRAPTTSNPKRKTTRRTLSVFDKHQLAIARKTLTYSDAGANIMGGPTKAEAREIIKRLTGRAAKENPRKRSGVSNPATVVVRNSSGRKVRVRVPSKYGPTVRIIVKGEKRRLREIRNPGGGFTTIAHIRRASKAAGGHFFDRDTMRFFNSRVYPGVYGGRYFVTSEQAEASDGTKGERRFTVREAVASTSGGDGPSLSVRTVPGAEFQQFTTLASARAKARSLGGRS